MMEGRRHLFRPVAFERYVRGRDRVVLPRYIRPGALAYVWAVLGLILISAALAAAAPIPKHAAGTATLLEPAAGGASPTRLVVVVPAAFAAQVQPGPTVAIRTVRGQLLTATIHGRSGETANQSQLGAAFEAHLIPPASDSQTADLSPGQPLQAQVQVGVRPAWALFSPFGQSGEE